MKEIKCDILVIGAGPAGSSAAWSASKEGLKVIIIDKKKIPTKDACAETLSKALLELLPFHFFYLDAILLLLSINRNAYLMKYLLSSNLNQ